MLGDLRVSHSLLEEHRFNYDLKLGSKKVGRISELDSWRIDGAYAYGSMEEVPGRSTHGSSYFVFDCRSKRFDVFSNWQAAQAFLATLGVDNARGKTENVINMKYNERLFSNKCPHQESPA